MYFQKKVEDVNFKKKKKKSLVKKITFYFLLIHKKLPL